MNKKIIKNLSVILIILFSASLVLAEGGDKKSSVNKITGSPVYKKFNINNISTYFKNDGESDINPNGNSGFEFPKGSGKTAIFQAGFLWGGKVEGQIRVGGSVYRQGTVPGKILNSGVPAPQLQREDPNLAHVRNYRVRPDIIPPEGPRPAEYIEGDVTSEVNDGEGSADDIIAAYYRDWREWRAVDGAPFTDMNNDGVYDPAVDIPGVTGADQTIWFVCNDTDPNQSQFMYGSLPMGIEQQVTVWGYNRTGALGNMLFRKYKIINKSNTTFEDMYVSMWNDPDLGDASDDFSGCDTLLSLTYVYNANATDNIYGRYPAAAGFDFFQGPIVESPGDSAIFDGQWILDYRNLPMTAHYFYINPDAVYRDPTQGQYQGTLEWYNFMQGRLGTTGDIFPDPTRPGERTTFTLYGDPVARTGWFDGLQHPPGDRRAGMASGPFDMAPGDVQEIVVAEIAAGGFEPVDRLSAISLLKFYDLAAQFAYDNFFDIPPPPPPPQVTPAVFDREVVLQWGGNIAAVNATENYDNAGFQFEGYNIYQLPNPSATKEQARLLATFDIVNSVGKIYDLVFDISTGTVVELPVQFGNDFGIQRYFRITTDAFNAGLPLNNGSRYYFAVTAYAYNSELIANNNLENSFTVITVVPQTTDPGVRYLTSHGDTLAVTHVGPSDGAVYPVVIDPSLLTGHTYQVTFSENQDGDIVWTLRDQTASTNLLVDQMNQSGDAEYPFTFGTQVKVQGPPPGVKQADMFDFPDNPELWGWDIPSGTRRWTWAGADGFHFEGFRGAIGWASPAVVFGIRSEEVVPASELKNVLIKYGTVADGSIEYENPGIDPDNPPADENFSYAYRYMRGAAGAPARPEFEPYIVNPLGGYRFQDFKKSAPISVWDVEDPANPRRLTIGYLENNVAGGLVDGRYFPGDFNTNDNVAAGGPREWLFIFDDDYSETPNPDYMTDILGDAAGLYPVMYFVAAQRRGLVPYSPGGTGEDQLAIFPNKINTPDDVFTFVATAPTYNAETARQDVQSINVFPNPYYGVNPQEINKYERFVTFNHLPEKATIRIFNLAGQLVRTIEKNSTNQYQRWDLLTDTGLPVASGLFIVYIDMPDLGTTKILKSAIIQEQQILDRF